MFSMGRNDHLGAAGFGKIMGALNYRGIDLKF